VKGNIDMEKPPPRKLILVKHAPPEVVPGLPPEQWTLGAKGLALCGPLAAAVKRHQPGVIVSSEETKAAETSRHVAEGLSVPWHTATGLHEHDRSTVPHMHSGEFISMMELLFRKPGELVLGEETAAHARQRFETAVKGVLAAHPGENVAVVSHGTVIALVLARGDGRLGFQIWRQMGLPSLAVLDAATFDVLERVDRV
jgi:broad specificity phosphatase PhoE